MDYNILAQVLFSCMFSLFRWMEVMKSTSFHTHSIDEQYLVDLTNVKHLSDANILQPNTVLLDIFSRIKFHI